MADQLVLGDPKAPRFVLWNGELLPTPSGPDVLTFRLLSLWGKIRAGLGAIGIKKPLPGEASSLVMPPSNSHTAQILSQHRQGTDTQLTVSLPDNACRHLRSHCSG